MISEEDYVNVRNNLFLDSAYTLLHETQIDKADSILQNGINLKKEYNVQIDRILTLSNTEDEIRNYHYHTSITNPAIIFVSIPKSLFRNIPISTSTAHLFLNCFLEKETSSPSIQTTGIKLYPVKGEKYASTLPSLWINGYFNKDTDFVANPKYILRQEAFESLLASQEDSIWKKFTETYPEEAYKVAHNYIDIKFPSNTEYEK